jgi:hypothetical protein
MGFNDHIDEALSARLRAMLDQGYLYQVSDAARGVARQVIEGGTGGLSDAQQRVYDREIIPALKAAPRDEDLL